MVDQRSRLGVRPTVTAYPEAVSRALWQGHVFGALPLVGRG